MALKHKPCAYCGTMTFKRERGHVVPDCVYPPSLDRRIQRITVPECARCKMIWQDAETQFRNMMMVSGEPNAYVRELWEGPVTRSFDKPSGPRWISDLIEQFVPVVTEGGPRHMVYPGRDRRGFPAPDPSQSEHHERQCREHDGSLISPHARPAHGQAPPDREQRDERPGRDNEHDRQRRTTGHPSKLDRSPGCARYRRYGSALLVWSGALSVTTPPPPLPRPGWGRWTQSTWGEGRQIRFFRGGDSHISKGGRQSLTRGRIGYDGDRIGSRSEGPPTKPLTG